MCTVSWRAGHGRLSLCFNRDERKDRAAALLPASLESDGLHYLSALDPVGGGSWLCVNELGLCVFLLNNYAAARAVTLEAKDAKSRGTLPVSYAGKTSRAEARAALQEADFGDFLPFYLGLADCEGVDVFAWDGRALTGVNPRRDFLTTSSFKTELVQDYRCRRFEEILAEDPEFGDESRRRFHTELVNADAAFNPLMVREESRTHSVSAITVDEDSVALIYEATRGDTRVLEEPIKISIPRKNLLQTL